MRDYEGSTTEPTLKSAGPGLTVIAQSRGNLDAGRVRRRIDRVRKAIPVGDPRARSLSKMP